MSFYNQRSSKTRAVEDCGAAGVEPLRALQCSYGGEGQITLGQMGLSEDTLGHIGRNGYPFLEHIWERWHCLSGDQRAGWVAPSPSPAPQQ